MIIKTLAAYIRDLLTHDAALIVLARENFDRPSTTANYILVDDLLSQPIGRFYSFNGTTEKETFTVQMRGDFTIDFFGTNALANAVKFLTLQAGQKSYELQRDLGFMIGHCSGLNDLKSLDGVNYNNRYQLQLSILYNETTIITTLRIDTEQLAIINDL